jgi:uncharacterized repeat protein (TIGR02543 family)
VLIVSDDGTYELTVGDKTSTGTAKKSGSTYTLTPSSPDADSFTVTVKASGVTGMSGTITFDDDTEQEAPGEVEPVPPENVPDKYRWTIWRDSSSTATIENFEVDDVGKATITIGGTPETDTWKITAEYKYTSKAKTAYKYVIEAWTEGESDRDVIVQYYEDNDARIYMMEGFRLTETPKEYTVYGQRLPKQGEPVRFQCAGYTGTFYLKIISIEEYEPGELTITNFRGTPGLLLDKWTSGDAKFYMNYEWGYIDFGGLYLDFYFPAPSNSITLNVFNKEKVYVSGEDGEYMYYERTTPFNGTAMVEAGNLRIDQSGDDVYVNKVPITFTKGKASINFGTQMEKYEDAEGGGTIYTITWNFNGGTPGAGAQYPAQIVEGTVLSEPTPDPTKAGNVFFGWYSDSGLTQAYDWYYVYENLTLYAKWDGAITYTVEQDGGTYGTASTTGIKFTFSESVSGLTAANITVGGTASKGSALLTGSGTSWTLAPITVTDAGVATVSINKTGIQAVQKGVTVHKEGQVLEYADFLGEWLMIGADNNWQPIGVWGTGYNETITLTADQFKLDSTYDGEYLYLNISSWTKITGAGLTVNTAGLPSTIGGPSGPATTVTYAEGWTLSLSGGTTNGYSVYSSMNLYKLNEPGTAQIRRSNGVGTIIPRVYVKQGE